MAFREWLTPDGRFVLVYPWLSSAGDKFIEHGHRLLAIVVGLLAIGLAVVTMRSEPRTWVRVYGICLLIGVVAQGLLGGMRVVRDERVLALLHGCVGPLFFSGCAGMVAVTSPSWNSDRRETLGNGGAGSRVAGMAVLTAVFAYLQLGLGTVVRHSPFMISENAESFFRLAVYGHVAMALVVILQSTRLAAASWGHRETGKLAIGLSCLAWSQVLLGSSSWVVKYGMPTWLLQLVGETGHFNRAADVFSAAIVTAHGAVGALIIALSVVIALRAGRVDGIRWFRTVAPGRKGAFA